MNMLFAYCDESYSSDIRTTPYYVVAGFIGEEQQWTTFSELWRSDIQSLRISRLGFHTSKCANGAPPYDRLSRQQRYEIQYRLIVDIVAAKLFGVIAAIDMTAYRAVKTTLSSYMRPADRQYNEHMFWRFDSACSKCVKLRKIRPMRRSLLLWIRMTLSGAVRGHGTTSQRPR